MEWEKVEMKKILPAIVISSIFTALMVTQLLINGQELSASQTEEDKDKYTLFENQFAIFKDTSFNRKKIELALRKEPIVIINFWASWCRPCVSEFRTINALIGKFPEKIFVVGINNDTEGPEKAVAKVQKDYKLKFESIVDKEGKYADQFKIVSVPSSIVYYKGKVLKVITKEFDFTSEEFISLIESKI